MIELILFPAYVLMLLLHLVAAICHGIGNGFAWLADMVDEFVSWVELRGE